MSTACVQFFGSSEEGMWSSRAGVQIVVSGVREVGMELRSSAACAFDCRAISSTRFAHFKIRLSLYSEWRHESSREKKGRKKTSMKLGIGEVRT